MPGDAQSIVRESEVDQPQQTLVPGSPIITTTFRNDQPNSASTASLIMLKC
jgi:hypothetical protein